MSKVEVVFEEELNYISSYPISDFVVKCFNDLVPDYFWDFSASSSHKYHPKISNIKHGLVLHTKLCVWWGRKIADSFGDINTDIIVASLLLHDLQKFGQSLDENNKPTLAQYASSHGPILAAQLENVFDGAKINDDVKRDIDTIITCVALHMGRWTNEPLSVSWREFDREEDDQLVRIVHLADFVASKKIDEKLEELNNWKMPS